VRSESKTLNFICQVRNLIKYHRYFSVFQHLKMDAVESLQQHAFEPKSVSTPVSTLKRQACGRPWLFQSLTTL
jgi:hypothetical protein